MTRNAFSSRLSADQAAWLERTMSRRAAEFGGFDMVQTTSADVIVPEVWGDMMEAEFVGRLIFGQDGGAFATVDTTLEGQPGERVSTAKWKAMSELEDIAETDVLVPEKLDTEDGSGPIIKEAGKAAEVTDRALLVGVGDPLAEVRRQFGLLTSRKVDRDLVAAAYAPGALTAGSADVSFSADVVADALAEFGDDADPADFAGFVIHSRQRTAAFKSDDFLSADKYGGQSVLLRGEIGSIYGVPIVVNDGIKITGTGATSVYDGLLVKRGALGLYYKRRPVVETDRDILARSTVVTTNIHYAVDRLKDNGVCVVKTKR